MTISNSDPLILEATSLTRYQGCKRWFLLDHDYRVLRWRPKVLFDACLRKAIFQISAGLSAPEAAATAKAQFMQSAANPGLDIPRGGDPYQISLDWCAMLETIPRALARLTLLTLHDVAPIRLNSSVYWQPLSWADESGMLHRWITIDRFDRADLVREGHSWWVMGDIATTKVPMMLHVIEIGRQVDGRRHSPWARAWKHPKIPHLPFRFKADKGDKLANWTPHYLSDHHYIDKDSWVDVMWREEAAQPLIKTFNIVCPPDAVCVETVKQILQEASSIKMILTERGSSGYSAFPMSRGVCDGLVPCPYQEVCYSSTPIDPEATGLFQVRKKETVAP